MMIPGTRPRRRRRSLLLLDSKKCIKNNNRRNRASFGSGVWKNHWIQHVVLLLLLLPRNSGSFATAEEGIISTSQPVSSTCRSTPTEIKWSQRAPQQRTIENLSPQQQRRLSVVETTAINDKSHTNNDKSSSSRRQSSKIIVCFSQSLQDAKKDAFSFLRQHVMEFDKAKLGTMGFGGDEGDNIDAPDGLDQGLIGPTIDLALRAKIEFPWTDALPQPIFYEYVLNYANLNEDRSNWRPLLWDILTPLLLLQQDGNSAAAAAPNLHHYSNHTTTTTLLLNTTLTPNDVVRLVNQKLWTSFPGHNTAQTAIYFQSGQTPLIYDPMSVIVYGYASCTGLAILLVNALRTVGIAARVVGTPAWNQNRTQGNHNWIEVYNHHHNNDDNNDNDDDIDPWIFLEPSANQTHVDDLTTQPCDKWFCGPGRFPPPPTTTSTQAIDPHYYLVSKVYSARLVFPTNATTTTTTAGQTSSTSNSRSRSPYYFPMAWEWDCHDVPGDDRTDYYQRICSQCNHDNNNVR